MKTTLEFPDDLMIQVKIEAARRRRKLKELVPELVRAGLDAQRGAVVARSPADLAAGAQWLDDWLRLGAEWSAAAPARPSAREILEADRR
ncbi:MAG: hypothetical protein ABI780_14165 [Ardenticatenales bacterium]